MSIKYPMLPPQATLLYGVLSLQRDFPGQPVVPLEAVNEASRRLHAEAAMREALPRIRSQFESLEAEVGGFMQDENGGGGGLGAAPVGGNSSAGTMVRAWCCRS